MNKEMTRLIEEIEIWIESCKRQRMDKHVEAYEHVLVMINSVTLLFEYGIGVGNPDWGKKK